MSLNAYESYREAQITSADKGKLILILYEGAMNTITEAINLIKTPPMDYQKIAKKILKAQSFIFELMGSLNMEAGEIAHNLYKLYDYMIRSLIQADLKKDAEPLENVLKMLKSLNEAWEHIVLKQKPEPAVANNSLNHEFYNEGGVEGRNFSIKA